jgi:phage terminase large subunit-like protein
VAPDGPVGQVRGPRDGETPRQWRERMLAELKGEPCFLGMDLSAKIDLTAVVQIFRRAASGSGG